MTKLLGQNHSQVGLSGRLAIRIWAFGGIDVTNLWERSCGLSSHVLCLVLMVAAPAVLGQIALPTSKRLAEPVPGEPQRLNSLPMTAAISPDGRYLAVVNAGYGTFESHYQQSIAVLDIQTGKVTDFPEPRTAIGLPQTLYSGLAFGKDGTHLYAVFDSLTAPKEAIRTRPATQSPSMTSTMAS